MHRIKIRKLTAVLSAAAMTLAAMTAVMPDIQANVYAAGTDLYVGYAGQSNNYSTVQEAVDAAAKINPSSENDRVEIHIAPGTYREQVIVNTPYISFVNDSPSEQVLLTWYYGIGYKYYSVGSDGFFDKDAAASKSAKAEPNRWGCTVRLEGNADYFRAENITFENSFNRYMTDEEIADGVEPSGSCPERQKDTNVQTKAATERAAAMAAESDYFEFYQCKFLSNQDTLFTKSSYGYFKDCFIEGNTDYIYGSGNQVFEECELSFKGYSGSGSGGCITAQSAGGGYLFYNCEVTANSELTVKAGHFGRPWNAEADVAFVNTVLQYEDIITSAGWTTMSSNSPENANYKEYNTTANGKSVDTSKRISGTVVSSESGLTPVDYFDGWTPYYMNYTASDEPSVTYSGNLVAELTPDSNALPSLWSIDTDLQIGDPIYMDRDVTYTSIPDALIGAEAILTPCDAKKIDADLAQLTAKEDLTLVIVYDSRVTTAASWLSDWNTTGAEIVNDQGVVYDLYSKEVKAGETVTLATNGQTSGCTGYAVIAAPAGTVLSSAAESSENIMGDVDMNGTVNAFDLAIMKNCISKQSFASDDAKLNADVTGDGNVDVADAALLTDFIVGRDVTFADRQTPKAPTEPPTEPDTGEDALSDAIYVSANGSSGGNGSQSSPYDLATAIKNASAGDTICLAAGTYQLSSTIKASNSGTASDMITVTSYNGDVTLDFSHQETSSSNRGVTLSGDYWHWYGIEIKNAGDNGMICGGSNNIIELCRFEGNQDTGLQISATGDVWPANNLILNCTSCNNIDDATMENADGFAAKLTCGDGNVFDGCISYNNSDDGWDLFAKTATGPIGVVTLRNCVAFRNGYTEDGRGYGDCDGNGFKLGGSGVGSAHVVENCIAFENWHCGFVDNNNPELYGLKNCTSYNNCMDGGSNFRMYRATAGTYSGLISYKGKYDIDKDTFEGTIENSVYYYSSAYYQVDSKTSVGSDAVGSKVSGPTDNDFVSLSVPGMNEVDFHEYWRNADGSVNTRGYLEAKSSSSLYGKGAVLK